MTWQSMLNVVRNSKKILKFIVFFCYSLQLYALFENFMRRLCHNLQVIIISVKCQMQSAKRNPDKTRVISAEEERRSPGYPPRGFTKFGPGMLITHLTQIPEGNKRDKVVELVRPVHAQAEHKGEKVHFEQDLQQPRKVIKIRKYSLFYVILSNSLIMCYPLDSVRQSVIRSDKKES